ncbi:MAG: hypothetical protein JW941_00420 [Candidatus Coatesbacteria bacterium]|nr:hypothetical protein [Candidatus Coatesbacteria bacterium]
MAGSSRAFDERSQLLGDLHTAGEDVRRFKGWQTASIRRLIGSEFEGVGLPPTDAYASGLVDLKVSATYLPENLENGEIVSAGDSPMRFEFWNVEVFMGDEIVFQGATYEVMRIEEVTPRLQLGSIKADGGSAVFDSENSPEEAVGAMCIISTKPAGLTIFKLEYRDENEELKVSDAIEFAEGCSVGEFSIVNSNGSRATITSIENVVEFEGDLGAGIIWVLDECPFRTRAIGELRNS